MALALGAALVGGCASRPTAAPPAPTPASPTAAAGTADVGRARTAVTALVDRVVGAAQALDEADARCAVGDRVGARSSRRARAEVIAGARAAVLALPAAVRAYRAALSRLRAEPPAALPAVQRAAAAGRAEAAAFDRMARTAADVWARYAQLDHDEAVWVTRAFVPWYRSTQESANAYAVLTDRLRAPIAAARRELAVASQALAPLSKAAVAAFAAADRALAAP